MKADSIVGHVIWPEDRWVTVGWVEVQFEDAVANGHVVPSDWGDDVQSKFEALSDAGLLTIGRAT